MGQNKFLLRPVYGILRRLHTVQNKEENILRIYIYIRPVKFILIIRS